MYIKLDLKWNYYKADAMHRDAGLNLYGIVEVADYSRRFSRGGVTEEF